MTDSSIVIAFSKETPAIQPLAKVGYDLNHKSIVGSDGARFDLSNVARLHTEYGLRKSEFHVRHPHDRRPKKKSAGAQREKERIKQALTAVSKRIVEKAVKNREAIVLERLKGIRKAHRKNNWKDAPRAGWPACGRSGSCKIRKPTRRLGKESKWNSSTPGTRRRNAMTVTT